MKYIKDYDHIAEASKLVSWDQEVNNSDPRQKPMISSVKYDFTCKKPLFRITGIILGVSSAISLHKYQIIALFMACGFISACTPTITSVCPPIQKYSFQFNQSLATEIEALPNNSLIPRVVSDYINLRDQLKICRSK